MVPVKRVFFWRTIATESRRVSKSYSRTSIPPTLTAPDLTSYKRAKSETKVDLEEPVVPITPKEEPEATFKLMSERTSFSAVLL